MTEVLGRPIKYTPAWTLPFVWHMTQKRGHSMMLAAVMTFQYAIGIAGGKSATITPTLSALLGGREARSFKTFLEEKREVLAPTE